MDQLSGLDATFLALETPAQAAHVASLAIYGVPEGAEDSVFPALCRTLAPRIAALAPLRRRLAPVPFGLDRPYWVEDPRFDLDFHLRHISVPPPGRDAQLAELVARLHAQPLDRTRPLWEMYVIEGLEQNRFAIYTKLHLAAFDGTDAVDLITALADGAATSSADETREPAARIPGPLEMIARGLLGAARRPRKILASGLRTAVAAARGECLGGMAAASGMLALAHSAGLGRVPGLYRALNLETGQRGDESRALPAAPAPHTPWNRAIGAQRRWTGVTVSIQDVNRVRRAFLVSLNDVVLAITSHALRDYLDERDALPADPMIAMVPVSLRAAGDEEASGHRIAMALTDLATDESDPVARLMRIHRAMRAAKELYERVPARVLEDVGRIGASLVAGPALALARTGIGERVRPPFNVTISNLSGPRAALSLGGAPLFAVYPLSVVAQGQGLNVAVVSYRNRLHFGLTVCRDLVPDVAELGRGLSEGLEILCKLADASAATIED
jgi:WS/DGAT/MGAT family acyltransferase